MTLDLEQTYLLLSPDGSATPVPGGDAFWSQPEAMLDRLTPDWLVSELSYSADWANWEMHPAGDEFVYLLSGEATLLLQHAGGVQAVPLAGRAAIRVPRGVWHTADVSQPTRLLHITRGAGTQHRPR
jgi:mannose-6-phosphate isomerase-like protein (cupin superfamily)